MVMAYLLQDEPLGLKSLALRHANIKMRSYMDVVGDERKRVALEYLSFVSAMAWPKPEPVLEYRKGVPHLKQPQDVGKKARGIVRDVEKGKVLKDGPVEARKRWGQIKEEEGRGMVEDILGPMPDAYLQDVDPDEAREYACADADMTLRVYHTLLGRMQSLDMTPLLDVEWGVIQFVSWMITGGMPASRERFARMSDELRQGMEEIEREITVMTGFDGQLTSHDQVSHLLYDTLGLRQYLPKKRTKKMGKTMTGDDVLAQIEHRHPVIPLIRRHRKLAKLDSTYACGVPRHIRSDGRLHPDFRNTNTDTGRLSCADPNLMAQPKRDKKWAKKLRQGFVVPDGYAIVSMDYSQIELRMLAEEADEQSMIRAFRENLDIHSLTALETTRMLPTWEMDTEEVRELIDTVDKLTERLPSKNTNFGIVYGITPEGLCRLMVKALSQVGSDKVGEWTDDFATEYIRKYFERRPGIKTYVQDTVSMARRHGYVWDWSGRIRRIPGARLKNEYKRSEAERQACNARIQMGAQSVIKKAMADLVPVYQGWRDQGWDLWPAIQIHDDIVSFVPLDLVDVLVPVQKEIMEGAKQLKSGVRVDVEWSLTSWGEMEDWV
jgi:DNA polymerase-1